MAPDASKYPGLWFFNEARFLRAFSELKTVGQIDPDSEAYRD